MKEIYVAYLLFFLAGLFGANGIPHFVKGITGQQHMTPFSKPSSAVVNVIWGFTNFMIATMFFYGASGQDYEHIWAVLAGFTGVFFASVSLAMMWRGDAKARGK